jgi:hypothetical protein
MTPTVIVPQMQMSDWDCAVAALAMLLEVPYADVRRHVRAKAPTGVSVASMRRIGTRLGKPLVWRTFTSDEDAIGVLYLTHPDRAHAVLYVRDTVYDPASGQWWTDADTYFRTSGYTPDGLLMREAHE